MDSMDLVMSIMGGLGAAALVIYIIVMILCIMAIVANWKYIKAVGKDPAISTLIPFWSSYTMANTVDADSEGKVTLLGGVKISHSLFVWYWAIALLINLIPAIGSIACLVINIMCGATIYREAYMRIDGKQANEVTGIAIASCFLPIFMFKVLSKNNQMNKQ